MDNWTYPDPGLLSTDPMEMRLYAISLKHYVKVARDILQEDDFTWRYKWNLNCNEKYNYRKWFEVGEVKKFAISLSADKRAIEFVESIALGSNEAVSELLSRYGSIERSELASFGGRVSEALKIGRLIREKNLTTAIVRNCNSACTLVFIGGVKRIMHAPLYSLGFHRARDQGVTVADDDYVYGEIKDYADEMIGNGQEFVSLTISGEGWDFYNPARKTLCDLKIATSVEGVCGK